jgi:hypothetical protein
MGIFTTVTGGSGKQKWTRAQDALLIKLANEGKSRKEISKETGHPENSITYRVRFIKAAEEKLNEGIELKFQAAVAANQDSDIEVEREVITTEAVLNSIKY